MIEVLGPVARFIGESKNFIEVEKGVSRCFATRTQNTTIWFLTRHEETELAQAADLRKRLGAKPWLEPSVQPVRNVRFVPIKHHTNNLTIEPLNCLLSFGNGRARGALRLDD